VADPTVSVTVFVVAVVEAGSGPAVGSALL
jgi:hypothetical protein